MTWVKAENAKTSAVLEKDPRYAASTRRAGDGAGEGPHSVRLVHGGALYNFWQDSAHVRGIWRSTTLASYRTASPVWTTVLDLDALAKAEKANWVWHGADCAQPAERRCLLIALGRRRGRGHGARVRPGDARVRDGRFRASQGKQESRGLANRHAAVSREWKAGELTASGYPYIVKRLVRGQPLATRVEIFRGETNGRRRGAVHDRRRRRAIA